MEKSLDVCICVRMYACVCMYVYVYVWEKVRERLRIWTLFLVYVRLPYYMGNMRVKITYQMKGVFCPFPHSTWILKEVLNKWNKTSYPKIFSEFGKWAYGPCAMFFSSVKCHPYHTELLERCNKTHKISAFRDTVGAHLLSF